MPVGEAAAERDVFRPLPCRGHQTHWDGLSHPGDDKEIAGPFLADQMRSAIAKLRIDVIDVRVGGFGDVRVGRDDLALHGCPPWYGRRSTIAREEGVLYTLIENREPGIENGEPANEGAGIIRF